MSNVPSSFIFQEREVSMIINYDCPTNKKEYVKIAMCSERNKENPVFLMNFVTDDEQPVFEKLRKELGILVKEWNC